MNIQPIDSYNINMQGRWFETPKFVKRIYQKVVDKLPDITIKDNADLYSKIDTFCSHPAYNRLIMGGTALLSQPLIDANNKKVDKETRKISTYRTIAKIIAGTAVGLVVRSACFKLTEKCTDINSTSKFAHWLLPQEYITFFREKSRDLGKYRNTISTGLGLAAMSITNFLLDAPATVWLTNKFIEWDKNKQNKIALSVKGGIQNE